MSKQIVLRGVSLLATAALVSGATFAFFSDEGTSSDNVFAAGTLDMQLSDDNETAQDNVTATWGLSAAAPGDAFTGDLEIKNSGTVAADHIELQFANTVTDSASPPGSTSTTPMDRVVQITQLDWDSDGNGTTDTDLLASVSDSNSNIIKDLDDIEAAGVLDNISFAGTQSNDHKLTLSGTLHGTLTTSEHQGDSVTTVVTVTMNQDVSQ